jgi:hypothetical protein
MKYLTPQELEVLVNQIDQHSLKLTNTFLTDIDSLMGKMLAEVEAYILSGFTIKSGRIVYSAESLQFALNASDNLIQTMQNSGYSSAVREYVESYAVLIPLTQKLYSGITGGGFSWQPGQVEVLNQLQGFQLSYLTNEPFIVPAHIIQQALYESVLMGVPYSQLISELKAIIATDSPAYRYISRLAHDSIMQFSRTMDAATMTKTGFYFYPGTIIKTTRDFCRKRVGGVYAEAEVESWNSKSWQGKAPGDVRISCGGYNCRHRLLPVSEGWAKANGVEVK